MRILNLSLLLCYCLISNIKAQQCDTYIQMVKLGIDACGVLPQVVATQQFLLPCSAPAGLNLLEEGDFAYIEYRESGCANICLAAPEVDITCLSLPVGVGEEEADVEIKVFPTIIQDRIYIEGEGIIQVEVYNEWGGRVMMVKGTDVSGIDVSSLVPGVYFIRLIKEKGIQVKRMFKL